MDLGEAGTGKQGNSVFCATLASHRRPFATVDIVQNCLAFPGLRSDPCVDRAALACSRWLPGPCAWLPCECDCTGSFPFRSAAIIQRSTENLAEVLKQRSPELPPAIQMCDACPASTISSH